MISHLKSNNFFGQMMILIGILVAVPLFVLFFYPQDSYQAYAFMIPAFSSIILGIIICMMKPQIHFKDNWKSSIHVGSLSVLYAWILGVLLGALPFYISGQLTFVQSLFEAVSGWTTTGLSVVDVTKINHLFQFHRCFMQFCGGLGFIMMILLFIQEKQAANLYDAEGHPDRLQPQLINTARTIFLIYFAWLMIGSILYYIFGMNWFDSIFHAMCSLSTGGFSTQVNSIGEYNSIMIEWITIVLMIVGTTNFAVLLLMIKGKWKDVFKVSELRLFAVLTIVFTILIALGLSYSLYISFSEGFRHAVFNVVSALSTTGYSTMPYSSWPPFTVLLLIILMIIGGGYGSTAGGIKLVRIYIGYKLLRLSFVKRLTSKRKIHKIYYYRAQGKTEINSDLAYNTLSYILIYIILFVIGTVLVALFAQCDLQSAMFDFASSLGTVGLSIGITGPTTNAAVLIVEMFGMLLGRLEIYVFFVGFASLFQIAKTKLKHIS